VVEQGAEIACVGERLAIRRDETIVSSLPLVKVDDVLRPSTAAVPARGSMLLSSDGKTLRGTIPRGSTRGTHLLAAYLPKQGVVLAQVDGDQKENEIVAAPRLLANLDLTGTVVTGDAMQTQRDLSIEIGDQGGDYLWTVKDNQPTLRHGLETLFDPGLLAVQVVAPRFHSAPTNYKNANNKPPHPRHPDK
jgi:hypothetical protein